MARRARSFDISPDQAFWGVVIALSLCSLFFAWNVEFRRKQWQTEKGNVSIASGATVALLKVIDSDALSFKSDAGTFVVRILGIKGFNPKSNEPGLSGVGIAAVGAIEKLAAEEGAAITVEFSEKRYDRSGRLLAYVQISGKDLGLTLIAQGHAVAFTRFAFQREDAYHAEEVHAKDTKTGLWSNKAAVDRVEAWKAQWEAARKDD